MKKLFTLIPITFLLYGCPAPIHKVSIEADSQGLITTVAESDYVTIKKYCDEGDHVYWADKPGHSPSLFVLPNSCRVDQ